MEKEIDTQHESFTPGRSGLHIRWGVLTLSLAIFASACLGTLAVVASVQQADALSTVALALAVLAFAAQLIVSMLQSSAGAQQVAQTERVNSATQAALADIRATSTSLLSNQRELFTEVLQAALKEKIPSVAREVAEDSEGDISSEYSISDELEKKLSDAIDKAFSQLTRNYRPPSSSQTKPSHPLYASLRSFPSEEDGRKAFALLNTLTPWEAQRLGDFGHRFLDQTRERRLSRLTIIQKEDAPLGPAVQGLANKGIISITKDSKLNTDARYLIKLTDRGVDVARFTTAVGRLPDWLAKMVHEPSLFA
jgi:hypothetical protein